MATCAMISITDGYERKLVTATQNNSGEELQIPRAIFNALYGPIPAATVHPPTAHEAMECEEEGDG